MLCLPYLPIFKVSLCGERNRHILSKLEPDTTQPGPCIPHAPPHGQHHSRTVRSGLLTSSRGRGTGCLGTLPPTQGFQDAGNELTPGWTVDAVLPSFPSLCHQQPQNNWKLQECRSEQITIPPTPLAETSPVSTRRGGLSPPRAPRAHLGTWARTRRALSTQPPGMETVKWPSVNKSKVQGCNIPQ